MTVTVFVRIALVGIRVCSQKISAARERGLSNLRSAKRVGSQYRWDDHQNGPAVIRIGQMLQEQFCDPLISWCDPESTSHWLDFNPPEFDLRHYFHFKNNVYHGPWQSLDWNQSSLPNLVNFACRIQAHGCAWSVLSNPGSRVCLKRRAGQFSSFLSNK